MPADSKNNGEPHEPLPSAAPEEDQSKPKKADALSARQRQLLRIHRDIEKVFGEDKPQLLSRLVAELGPASRVIAEYMLDGPDGPMPTFDTHDAKIAMHTIAGHDAFKKKGVYRRFMLVNRKTAGLSTDPGVLEAEAAEAKFAERLYQFLLKVTKSSILDSAKANCKGTDTNVFFPERGASTNPAKEICADCKIQEACAAHALIEGEKFGIWGGVSERQRRSLRQGMGLTQESRQSRQARKENPALAEEISAMEEPADEEKYVPDESDLVEAEEKFGSLIA